MLILLPPSETKAANDAVEPAALGGPLDLGSLAFPELQDCRLAVFSALERTLAAGEEPAMAYLKLSASLRGELERNAQVWDVGTLPAIDRYTGVLYDALEPGTLSPAARSLLAVGSALFGVLGAEDRIPYYRLTGSAKLLDAAGKPVSLRSLWAPARGRAVNPLNRLAAEELVVDLRSGTYAQLLPVRNAVSVRVESIRPDGSRQVVSHFNKHFKGVLARAIAEAVGDGGVPAPTSVGDVVEIARGCGFVIEVPEEFDAASDGNQCELTMVVEP